VLVIGVGVAKSYASKIHWRQQGQKTSRRK
jgi:hypothetical protein